MCVLGGGGGGGVGAFIRISPLSRADHIMKTNSLEGEPGHDDPQIYKGFSPKQLKMAYFLN